MNYHEALAYIASLAPRGWRLGLDRMEEFVRRCGLADVLGEPPGPRYLHVAGTNGKGSVTAYLQSMLVESGYRTGAFFSPFVYDIRERIQLGRELISREDFASIATRLQPIGEGMAETEFGGATEFEFKTAMGFAFWKEKSSEWVALEVGLGGRLDATNVVTPAASGIVSISLDHTSILGNTVEEIAREKAGIIKPGKTVVVGALPDAALRVVEEVAQTQGSEIWRLGSEVVLEPGRGDQWRVGTPAASYSGLVPGIRGAMQPENMAVAIAMMDAAGATCSGEALAHGAKLARVPGRFEIRQVRGQTVVLDGAHNSQAAEVLARSLDEEFPGKRIVLLGGMVGGHDPGDFFKPLARLCDIVLLTEIDFHRAVPPEELRHAIAEVLPRAQVVVPFTDAVELALAKASDTDGLLVVTGSFYLVGAVGRYLNSIT